MKEFVEFVGNLLYYLVVALTALTICILLVLVIFLAVQGCLYTLGQITPMLEIY